MIIAISQRFLNQLIYELEWEGIIWEFLETDEQWWGLRLFLRRN